MQSARAGLLLLQRRDLRFGLLQSPGKALAARLLTREQLLNVVGALALGEDHLS